MYLIMEIAFGIVLGMILFSLLTLAIFYIGILIASGKNPPKTIKLELQKPRNHEPDDVIFSSDVKTK